MNRTVYAIRVGRFGWVSKLRGATKKRRPTFAFGGGDAYLFSDKALAESWLAIVTDALRTDEIFKADAVALETLTLGEAFAKAKPVEWDAEHQKLIAAQEFAGVMLGNFILTAPAVREALAETEEGKKVLAGFEASSFAHGAFLEKIEFP